ncbi:hypothetical protein FSP39_018004 [Pinctada imbricata]|uniref:Protein CMSS1 n=1 Tax=Pinctada imbricata TaxID=66713 RepID=A0AA88XGK2_PINIB|nr:hypothetical protein FSP39_018004 [Pinctada imbricata]
MADDLEEEWWLKDKGSDNADSESDKGSDEASEINVGDDVKGDQVDIDSSKGDTDGQTKPEKRKRQEEGKKKKKKRKSITAELKEKGDDSRGSPEALVSLIEKTFKDALSPVEWDEVQLNLGNDFYPSSEKDHTPVSYLRSILPKWKKQMKTSQLKPGSPLLLVLTPSAIRAVQLNREINDFKLENCKCAKLFAKHFKINEQEKYLKKTVCHVAIGTPNRVNALLKLGALHLDSLFSVVLDWNWRDVKLKRMTDIPDVRKDLLLLLQTHVIPHVHHTKCKIGIL